MGRPQKYPWAVWLAPSPGTTHIDRSSYDDIAHPSLQSQIRVEARRREVGVDTRLCAEHPRCTVVRRAGELRTRYDWDRLLDGQPHPLAPSDFSTWDSFVRTARRVAAGRGITVRVKKVASGGWVQALDR